MSGKVELLQKNTVAKRLGVSERTIEKMVKDRKFPPPRRNLSPPELLSS